MTLNIENSLKYPIKDPKWKKKVLIGGALMTLQVICNFLNHFSSSFKEMAKSSPEKALYFIPLIAIVVFLVILFAMFTGGYYIKNINQRISKPDSILPDWSEWGNLFFIGFKATSATMIYIITVVIIAIILFVVMVKLIGDSTIGVIIGLIFLIPFLFFITILFSIANLAFATNLRFSSFFNFKLIKNLIKNNPGEFFLYLILAFAVSMLYSIVSTALALTIVGIVLLPFLYFYQFLIIGDLASQFVRNSIKIKD